MKRGFYRKIAWNNIKKNYRFFVPRILSEMGLLGCFYIAVTLAMDERLSQVKGGDYIPTFMWMGVGVLVLLSSILMFYTNSFLMKQRKREFGVYNVLGMEKRHIGKVLLHEGLISDSVAILGGVGTGILFYKLCSLLVCRLLEADIIVGFYFISLKTIIPAAMFFVLLDLITYFANRISIARMKPVELLASRSTREREPRIKWLLLIIGVAALGSGYAISVTTKNPLQALGLFFVAVILVIIGTYCLFVTGSTFVLKTLRKNERFYYHRRHMPAVSGLLYRMKQNAVGLASIAILATGVLVMISTTVSLYTGMDGTLKKNYPEDMYLSAQYFKGADSDPIVIDVETLEDAVRQAAEKNGLEIKSLGCNEYLNVSYYVNGGHLYAESELDADVSNVDTIKGLTEFYFITADTYESLTGDKLDISGREVVTCRISSNAGQARDMTGTLFLHGNEYSVKSAVYYFPISTQVMANAFPHYGVIVADQDIFDEIYENQRIAYGEHASNITRRVVIDFADNKAVGAVYDSLLQDIRLSLLAYVESQGGDTDTLSWNIDNIWDARVGMVGMFATLLFLGILLGAVSMFATVLIIYYKQISEGYEDRERFQIMEKIGMSREEVRRTINSQVLLVFFLPLVTAGIHMAFAYPMLKGMLRILMLYKDSLFLECSIITYAVFALVYVLIYRATSKTYYKIVH